MKIEAAEDAAREAKEKIENDAKMATMTPEKKEEFLEHLAKHEAEEAEHKKNKVLWVESGKGHDCEVDPNSKSPLAGCRTKIAPVTKYQPYVGAAETVKTTDERE